ncbi:SPOR domain-containing protein [Asaia bogorensis]|uniref:SPOR domain-containing protein n=1 Tax=Asaia bogorensis TaxID=91915 RepID=UPI000EFC1A0A|nr:SPOR domain-containing protein [Asaia bogorensis]
MNDDTPDWRDDQPGGDGGYDRPRQETGRGPDRRANDPRFTDTRPPSYPSDATGGAGYDGATGSPRGASSQPSSPRERLSADYDDEPVFRRRSAGAGGGLASLLGSDIMTRRLVYGAAGLGALLVVGVGGWSLLGGHSGGIPVIGPPPGPVRDRPADPGGMQIMGDGTDLDVTGKGEAHLAPEPEQPRPEALAARTAPETPPAGATAPAGSASAGAGQDAGADSAGASGQSASGGLPDTSVQKLPEGTGAQGEADQGGSAAPTASESSAPEKAIPEKAAPEKVVPEKAVPERAPSEKPAKAASTSPAASSSATTDSASKTAAANTATGGHMVQLAALGSEADAKATWSKLSKQASDLLSDRTPMIEQKTINGHVFYRLRVGGFDTTQAAKSFCVRLHARSIACTPAVF